MKLLRFNLEKRTIANNSPFYFLQGYFVKPQVVDNTAYVAPPIEIKYLAAGLRSQLSDGFWLRSVQDTSYCEKHLNDETCTGKSWFFSVVNLSIELDNQFIEAYYYGGLSLTVLIKDMAGASVVFDKAMDLFKHEWQLAYLSAYHALFNEKDNLKASRLYLRAGNNGAPSWVRLSAGKLALKGGDSETAEEILQNLIQREENPLWVKQLKEKLQQNKKQKESETK